jgi:hypothetical protein
MEMSSQLHAPAALPLGMEPPVTVGKEGGWALPQSQTGWCKEKSLSPARNQTLAVQPIVHHYTDSAIPNLNKSVYA